MATNTETYQIDLVVNGAQATSQVTRLQKAYDQSLATLKKMRELPPPSDPEEAKRYAEAMAVEEKHSNALAKSLSEAQHNAKGMASVLDNLSAAKPRELRDTVKAINEQLNSGSVVRGSAEWEQLQQHLADCKDELKAIRDEAKNAPTAFQELATSWRSAFSMDNLTDKVAAALTPESLMGVATQAVSAFTSMDAAMAETRKYTGQTAEEVQRMNDDFKQLDTRTSREQLNELAGAAGRLGITSTQEIEEFVDAADKINVALGDDLGDGAIDSIGKLAQMFGEADTLGLRGAMLATGSAVNDLAQSSSANAGYIVDFTADLSGVGKMAGFTQTQLMGLASALDQNMQEEATSSTVFSQLITKMYQDPAKFAQIAGQDVQEFTNLLKTDANTALLQFLQVMQDKGGFAEMAPMFESMNLNGTRAVGVLSAVASHLDQVREAQTIAADSYKEAESVTNEFNVQNTTAEATLEKLRKRVNDLYADLGSLLFPVVSAGVGVMNGVVTVLGTILTFVANHKAALALLTAAVVAYNAQALIATARLRLWYTMELVSTAAAKAKAVVMGTLKAAWIGCTAAVRGYSAALAAAKAASLTNPFTALATVIATLAAVGIAAAQAFRKEAQASEEAKAKAEAMADVRSRAAKSTEDEKARIAQLTEIIHSNTYSVDQRRQAVQALRQIIPAYVAEISSEGNVMRENTAAVDDYIKKLDQLAIAKAVAAKKEELARQLLEAQQRKRLTSRMLTAIDNEERRNPSKYAYTPTYGGTSSASGPVTLDYNANNRSALDAQREEWREKDTAADTQLKNVKTQLAALNEMIKENATIRETVVAQATAQPTGQTSQTSQTSRTGRTSQTTPTDTYKSETQAEQQAYKERQRITQAAIEEQNLTASQAYDLQAADLQAHYERLVQIAQKYNADTAALQAQATADAHKLTEQYLKADEQERRAAMEADLAADKQDENAETVGAARSYLDGETSYEAYQEALDRIAYEHAKARAEIMEAAGFDSTDEQQRILQYEITQKKDSDTAAADQKKKGYEDQFAAADTAAQQFALLAQMEEEGVITHEEAEQRKTAITEEQTQLRTQIAQQAYQSVTQLMGAASSYYAAQSQYEQAVTTKKYDAEIEKAGSNTKKGKKLEEKKQKELAAIKTKYKKKQTKIEIAQAIMTGAQAALNAWNSGMSTGGPWAPAVAAAFMALSLVQTGLQIATIKKQAQAEEAGYYRGGYTGGTNYRRRAGVVHEGEFVINHEALQNPAIAPVVAAIDEAQRTGRTAQLSADDVAATMPTTAAALALTGAAQPAALPDQSDSSAPSASSDPSDSSNQSATTAALATAIQSLNAQLAQGITAIASIDGQNGIYKQLKHFERLNK